MVDISAVITSMEGRAGYLGEALGSLARQSVRPDEVVVVLEGEDARWGEVVARFSGVFPIRVLRRPRVAGRAGPAKTLGIRQARGRYVVLLDDDDLALEDRIRLQVAFLERHPEYGWVCGRVERFRGRTVLGIWPEGPAGVLDFVRLFSGNPVAYSTVTLRKEAVRALGAFRKDLPLAPDYEAWLRLTRQGYRGYLLDEVVGRYRVHRTNITGNRRALFEAVVRIRMMHWDAHPDPDRARQVLRRTWRDLARALEEEGAWREAAEAWKEAWRWGRQGKDWVRGMWAWIRSGW